MHTTKQSFRIYTARDTHTTIRTTRRKLVENFQGDGVVTVHARNTSIAEHGLVFFQGICVESCMLLYPKGGNPETQVTVTEFLDRSFAKLARWRRGE